MRRESLAYIKKSIDVRICYVYVVRHTAAMTSPPINVNLAVKSQQTRTGTERRRITGELSESREQKGKFHIEH